MLVKQSSLKYFSKVKGRLSINCGLKSDVKALLHMFLARVDMDQCWRRQDQENRQRQRGGYYDEDIYDFEGTYLR